MSTADQNLLPLIASGDQSAVEDCLDRYGGLVWSLARRMCPTRDEAEDAVQEIFIEVWKNAGRFDASIASEVTFIAVIARRRLIDRRRRAGRRPDESTIIEETIRDGGNGDVEASQVVGEEAEIAREVMRELSEEQQRVLQLSIFYGQSHEKIARSTGLPLGTVKTHARRGLIRVRDLLKERRASRLDGSLDGSEVSS
ncbi:MAG: sigma-70 family RNA polymerase sigma factor [Planctomycetota bacterium]